MESNRVPALDRQHAADGYLLMEAIVGVVLLGVGALGIAAALGQAEHLAVVAVQRDREAGIRADLVAGLTLGQVGPGGWLPTADSGAGVASAAAPATASTPCWRRVTAVALDLVWVEARCGVGADDLPAGTREPGLLARR